MDHCVCTKLAPIVDCKTHKTSLPAGSHTHNMHNYTMIFIANFFHSELYVIIVLCIRMGISNSHLKSSSHIELLLFDTAHIKVIVTFKKCSRSSGFMKYETFDFGSVIKMA